jgi:hypothetical protein
MTKAITVKFLRDHYACEDQVDKFIETFGKDAEVVPSLELAKKYGSEFNIHWLTVKLLNSDQLKVYDEATAPAYKAYGEAIAPASKAYDEATAPALKIYKEAAVLAYKAYDEATASAYKTYYEATAPAIKAYYEATAPALKAYKEAIAVAFVKAWNI